MACTSTATGGSGSTYLYVGVKQASSYLASDLAAEDWEANMLDGGPTNPSWMRISGDTIDINGNFQGSYTDSNGGAANVAGQMALSANGEVTCITGNCPDLNYNPDFVGYMDASKTVIVGTYGVSATTPDAVLTVFTKMASEYSMSDLAGVWNVNLLGLGSGIYGWGRDTVTVKPNGTFTISRVYSTGSGSTDTGVLSISSDGTITCVSGSACGNEVARIVMAASKTLMIATNTDPPINEEIYIFTKTAGIPGVPTIGTVTPENAAAKVSFTPPASNGGSAITGYTVTSPENSSIKTTGKSSPITVKGLTNGTPYTFIVAAANKFGAGPASNPSNQVTPATAPSAPVIATVTAGDGEATVTFSEGSDGGSPITGYTVKSNPKGGVDSNAGSTSLSHQVTNLKSGKKYTFTVTATNAVGASTSKPSKPITIE